LQREGERRAQRPPGPVTPPPAASGTTADSARLSKPTGERMLELRRASSRARTRLQREGERRAQRPPRPVTPPPAASRTTADSARLSKPTGERMLVQQTPSTVAQTRLQREGERRAQRPPGPVTPPPAASGTTADSARLSKPTGERMLVQQTPSTVAQTRLQREGERRAQRPPGPVTPPPAASGTTADSARLSKPTGERMLVQQTPSTAAQTRLQREGERRAQRPPGPVTPPPAA